MRNRLSKYEYNEMDLSGIDEHSDNSNFERNATRSFPGYLVPPEDEKLQ